VFSTLNQWSTEELFFPIHDFEGTIYDNRAAYEKWDPAQHVKEWATPQLVRAYHLPILMPVKRLDSLTQLTAQIIHSELDYRLPITEGLSPFNILQAKGIPSKLLMFPDENHVSDTVSKPSENKLLT
jgi:dipeptidyl aminopeptidase/acylaminoacyl peptidase